MDRKSIRQRMADDGIPWVKWETGNEYVHSLPGHVERVNLEAWFDRRRQSLILAVTRYDESWGESAPCWAQIALQEVGPFFAHDELMSFSVLWCDSVAAMFGLPQTPDLSLDESDLDGLADRLNRLEPMTEE